MDHRERQLGKQFQDGGAYPKVRLGTMWYVIQTITGKEVETVGVIDKVVAKNQLYKMFCNTAGVCLENLRGNVACILNHCFHPMYLWKQTPLIFFSMT